MTAKLDPQQIYSYEENSPVTFTVTSHKNEFENLTNNRKPMNGADKMGTAESISQYFNGDSIVARSKSLNETKNLHATSIRH